MTAVGDRTRRAAVAAIKRLRRIGPLNRLITSSIRAALRVLGLRGEFFVKHLPRVGTTRFLLPNGRHARLHSRGDDWISNQMFWRGWDSYEPETTRLFWNLATEAT